MFVSANANAQFRYQYLQPNSKLFRQAQALEGKAKLNRDSILLAKAYYLYAEAHRIGGSHISSKEYYAKVIRLLKPRGDFYELGMAYLRINEDVSLTLESRHDFENIQTAIGIFKRIGSNKGVALAYNYLTSSYKRIWVWHNADLRKLKADPVKMDTLIQCLNNIEYYARQANDTTMLGEAYLQRADLFRFLSPKDAVKNYRTALELFESCKNDTAVIHTMCHLSAVFMTFKNYEQAGYYFLKSFRKLSQSGIKDYLLNSHVLEAGIDYYQKTGQWQKASETQTEYLALHIYRKQGEREVLMQAINAKQKSEEEEILLKAQNAELEKMATQRLLTLALSVLLTMSVLTAFVFFKQNRKSQRISLSNQELVKEQNHRVKNNLQIISSLLSLQAEQLTDQKAKAAVEESLLRVKSIAILHHRLYDGKQLAKVDIEEFIPEVVRGVLQTFGATDILTDFIIDPIFLSADKATPVGLILNELVTNSCKYAFPDNDAPRLTVICEQKAGNIHFSVEDNGAGIVKTGAMQEKVFIPDKNWGSFGTQVIEAQLSQLRATGGYDTANRNGKSGTIFQMDFTP